MAWFDIFTSQIFLETVVVAAAGVGIWIFMRGRGTKKEKVLVQERIKKDDWTIWPATLSRPNNPGETQLMIGNRKFIIPDEKQGEYVRINVKQKLLKGVHKLFLVETAQVVAPPENLTDAPSPVLDNQTVSGVVNRTSARRLANPKLPTNQLYIWLLMGAIVGISIGWILYPQFNHPPPIIEYCTRLLNGTILPRSCPGG